MFILLFVVLLSGSCSCYLRAHLSPAVSHSPSLDFNCYKKLECSKLNLPRLTQSHSVTNSWPWISSIDGWSNRSGWAQLSVDGRKRNIFQHSCKCPFLCMKLLWFSSFSTSDYDGTIFAGFCIAFHSTCITSSHNLSIKFGLAKISDCEQYFNTQWLKN